MTVDSEGRTGFHTSLTLSTAGFPVISYHDGTLDNLHLAICHDAVCTSKTLRTVDDSINSVGQYSSLALTTSGIPVVSYYDATDDDLKLAICENAACSSRTIQIVDRADDVGLHSSLALTTNDVPVISYYDNTIDDLKLAICANTLCVKSSILTLDNSTGSVGRYTSLALTSDNVPVVSYFDGTLRYLKLSICSDAACSSNDLRLVDNGTVFSSYDTSLALTSSNVPVISFAVGSGELKLAICKCKDISCLTSLILVLSNDAKSNNFRCILGLKKRKYSRHRLLWRRGGRQARRLRRCLLLQQHHTHPRQRWKRGQIPVPSFALRTSSCIIPR